ncbi:hypothetical protein V5O48_012169 [Marasmius crinis-equi]|uniref:Uncharacterized protein n=1 Tax=Marasmius crinis-equi TaxID=585013 RepID=A0ABR3F3J4_9AGAR
MSTEDSSPEVVAVITAGVKETLATVFIGYSVATTLYGITILQVYLYFKHYPKDPVFVKLLVLAFWFVPVQTLEPVFNAIIRRVLDTLTSTLVAHSLYTYIVLNFGDLLADKRIPWSFALESEIVIIITVMAQSYFAWQLLKLWPEAKYFPIAVFMLALATFAVDFKVTVQVFSKLSVEALSERSVSVRVNIISSLALS